MPTIRPDGDVTNNWTKSSGTQGFATIDDAVTPPTDASAAGDGLSISSVTSGQVQECSLQNPTLAVGQVVPAVELQVYVAGGNKRGVTIALVSALGTVLTSISVAAGAAAAWQSVTLTQNFTAVEVNDLRVRFTTTSTSGGGATAATVWAAYVNAVTEVSLTRTAADTVAVSDTAAAVVTSAPQTLVGTLTDDFNDNSIDTAKWPNTAASGVAESGGRAQVTSSTAYPGYRSAESYYLTDSALHVEVVTQPSSPTLSTYLLLQDAAGSNAFYFQRSGGSLYMFERVGGVDGATSVADDATNHRWRRIRHSSATGLVYWETSSDGVTWTVLRSKAPAIPLGPYQVMLVSGFSGTDTPTVTEFDNFNVAATGGTPTRTATDSVPVSDAATITRGFARTATDTAAVSDSAARARSGPRTAADSLTAADAASRAGTRTRAATDALSATDAASRAAPRARTATDTASVSDTAGHVKAGPRTTGDTVSASDTATGVFGSGVTSQSRTAADSVSAADAATRLRPGGRTGTDTVSASDVANRVKAGGRGATDTVAISDGASRAPGSNRTAEGSLTVSDTASRATAGLGRTATDSFTAGDAAARTSSTARSATDALTASDAATLQGLSRSAFDSLTVSDSATGAYPFYGLNPSFAALTPRVALVSLVARQSTVAITTKGAAVFLIVRQSAVAASAKASLSTLPSRQSGSAVTPRTTTRPVILYGDNT